MVLDDGSAFDPQTAAKASTCRKEVSCRSESQVFHLSLKRPLVDELRTYTSPECRNKGNRRATGEDTRSRKIDYRREERDARKKTSGKIKINGKKDGKGDSGRRYSL